RQAGEPRGRWRALAALGGVLEIVTGGKRLVAGPGEYRHPQIIVGGEVVPYSGHLIVHGRVHGVIHFRPVHGHDQNRAPAFAFDKFIRYVSFIERRSPLYFCWYQTYRYRSCRYPAWPGRRRQSRDGRSCRWRHGPTGRSATRAVL